MILLKIAAAVYLIKSACSSWRLFRMRREMKRSAHSLRELVSDESKKALAAKRQERNAKLDRMLDRTLEHLDSLDEGDSWKNGGDL